MDVFTIAGSAVDMNAMDAIPVYFREAFGSVPVLVIQRRGIALPGLPDPWLGRTVTWTHSGTLYFTGDVIGMNPHFDQHVGWVITYTCAGMRNRLDWFPHTDSATGLDYSAFNLTLTDPSVNLSRSGRTVGQILSSVLLMGGLPNDPENVGNVASIQAAGMGNYLGNPPAALPTVTAVDLSALSVIPPRPVYFGGEKLGDAIDSLLSQWSPNYRWWIDPSGNFRFLDLRTFASNTLTMGTDPVEPAELARDVSRCFQRVLVRGQPTAVMALLKLSHGDLTEDFSHDGLDNTAAKSAWTPAQFATPGTALSQGTVTVTSSTTVVYKSSSTSETWTSGYWDQSHQQGTINLGASVLGSAYTQFWSARIVSCPALSPGGTVTFTLDNPLPNTNYNIATITGLSTGASVVWTQYDISNRSLWPRLANQSTYPQAFVNASGTGATVLSSPMGLIFRADGSTFPLAYTFNTTTGKIRFIAPTYVIANNAVPTDVWIYQPINTNTLYAVWPHDTVGPPRTANYGGTSGPRDAVNNPTGQEGLRKTLTVTIDQWTDPGQFGDPGTPVASGQFTTSPTFSVNPTNMSLYAFDLFTSVADSVVEGEVTYYGFYAPAMTFGNALSIAGKDGSLPAYVTGWENLSLPIREVQIEWPQTSGQDYITRMRVSNRRDVYAADQFLKPPRQTGYSFGMLEGVHDPFGAIESFSRYTTEYVANENGELVPTGTTRTNPIEDIYAGREQAGIDRALPPGFGFEPSAGRGIPDLSEQLVAGMDFGAGLRFHTGPAAIARESVAASRLPLPTAPAPVEPGAPGGAE